MILRRLSQSLKQQNWTAIWIEFVLLVSGVFLGVQVSGWWQDQSDARREAAYLSALQIDFNVVIAELEGDAAEYESIAKQMSFLLEQSRLPKPTASVAELNAATRGLIRMEGTPIVSDTYTNLTGSGDLAIIKNQKIKNAMASFYSRAEVIKLVGNTHEMQLVNIFQPYIIKNLDYEGMLRETDGLRPPAEFTSDKIVKVLPTDEFRNVVAVKWDIVTDIRGTLLYALKEAREVQELLRKDRERKQ
jgi:hypothetical protein